MSTRCQIGILGDINANKAKPDILLYRHSDGYPGTVDGKEIGVLPDIVPFLLDFRKKRGIDVEYQGAQLMHHLIETSNKQMEVFRKRYEKRTGKKSDTYESGYTGFGICGDKQFHGDIEYYYAIYPDRVEVWDIKGENPKKWEKTFTVFLIDTKERAVIESQVPIGTGKKKLTADMIV